MSSTTTYLPFQTPIIKNAKVVKLELNPFLQNIISHSSILPPLFAQTDRPLQTTIVMIILKLPINITIHLIKTFILHQIQLPIQISTNITQINTTSTTQNPFIQLSHTITSQNIYSQNQGTSYPSTSYSNITQASQRRLHNPPLTHKPTDLLYQMHPKDHEPPL